MSSHPYLSMPDYAFWRRAISSVAPNLVDPVVTSAFKISPEDKVATGGSCFAQHIARYLQRSGYNYYIAETAHPIATPEMAKKYNYSEYSARYGNIYTSRQLLQLFDRAYGEFTPVDDVWKMPSGGFADPFRTKIQPSGFPTVEELKIDRQQHFAAVRKMFENLNVFVFTLGLTETWMSKKDNAVFPLCPGVDSGEFDDTNYAFHNLTVDEVNNDMSAFLDRLKGVNPAAKVILTVSPVPLVATAEDRHVLVSTTYSKSVLRVAAEMVSNSFENVAYFPSFEIITGDFNRGRYFANDCRSVLERGVQHVMRLFLEHYTQGDLRAPRKRELAPDTSHQEHLKEMERLVAINCAEEALDN